MYLGSDCYLRTLTYLKDCRVQAKQKCTQKQRYKMHPLLPEMEATLMFQQMTYIDVYINFISVTCSPHSPKMTIGWYQRTNRLIPIIDRLSVHLLKIFADLKRCKSSKHWHKCCIVFVTKEANDASDFFMTLEKDPQQEDFLQGRMLGNPYNSNEPGLGPLMRDVKNKICQGEMSQLSLLITCALGLLDLV